MGFNGLLLLMLLFHLGELQLHLMLEVARGLHFPLHRRQLDGKPVALLHDRGQELVAGLDRGRKLSDRSFQLGVLGAKDVHFAKKADRGCVGHSGRRTTARQIHHS